MTLRELLGRPSGRIDDPRPITPTEEVAISVLGTHAQDAVVAFEVDRLDADHNVDWTVSVRGRAWALSEVEDAEWRRVMDRPRPWADRPGLRMFQLVMAELVGHQREENSR